MAHRIPKPGDLLVAKSSLTLWTTPSSEGYLQVKNFEIGESVMLTKIVIPARLWLVYSNNEFFEYETPYFWDGDWNLITQS